MSLRQSPHLRPLRTLKSIILPNQKKNFSPRNFSYLSHITRPKNKDIFFVSSPASGWNWASDVLAYALGKHLLGEYNIQYIDAPTLKKAEVRPFHFVHAADARASNMKALSEELPNIDIEYCYHTHGYHGESPLWGLDQAKTVMIVRDFPTSLFSQYSKRKSKYESFEEFLETEKTLEKLIHFYNSWGYFAFKKSKKPVHIVPYEEMRTDTEETFKNLISFCFNIDIPDNVLSEALDYYSFEKQKEREKKFNKDEEKHFHYKGKSNYRDEMSPETYEKITKTLKENLSYNFGYSY